MTLRNNPLGLIREIDLFTPSTYKNRLFVTLDVDWAPDYVICEVSHYLQSHQIPATWFITHDSPAIRELWAGEDFEIGVHPNFSPLLMGKRECADARQVIASMRELAPTAKSFRCHSLVQSTPLLDLMYEAGFELDCNVFLPFTAPTCLFPWRHGQGVTRIPYCWEDDTWLLGACSSPEQIADSEGMKVIDVHPIHLWLNSEELNRYERVKCDLANEELLRKNRNHVQQSGVWNAFKTIVQGSLPNFG